MHLEAKKSFFKQNCVTLLTLKFALTHPSASSIQPKCSRQTAFLAVKNNVNNQKTSGYLSPFRSFICLCNMLEIPVLAGKRGTVGYHVRIKNASE